MTTNPDPEKPQPVTGTAPTVEEIAMDAATDIHDQYKGAIKALFGAEPFSDGSRTKQLITEVILTALRSATTKAEEENARLRAEAERKVLLAEGSRDVVKHAWAHCQRERDSFRAQLDEKTRECERLLRELASGKDHYTP